MSRRVRDEWFGELLTQCDNYLSQVILCENPGELGRQFLMTDRLLVEVCCWYVHVRVYMCVCTCACVHVRMYMCVCVCEHVYVHVLCVHVLVNMCVYICVCTCACVHVRVYMCVCTCV